VSESPQPGAIPIDAVRTRFCVWAPRTDRLDLELIEPRRATLPMQRDAAGCFVVVADAPAGSLYRFRFPDGRARPDPASRGQPQGVHGPSRVESVPPSAGNAPVVPPLHEHVIYELHVGTFTPDGTFDAVQSRLDDLARLGVTTIELMPVAEFPGARNWGYDGVCLYAAHSAYGGLAGLRCLVDAAHARGLFVFLDVVYNHLGPEGNYLAEFGPYFTDRYQTPWGPAVNLDGPDSDPVREFFFQNALFWTRDVGVDGLRLDAVHALLDRTARPFLQELAERIHAAAEQRGRRILLVAESSDNDPRLVRPPERGGYGLDGCWNDDYHHAIRTALTGEKAGYYAAFGRASLIAKALRDRFAFVGEYSHAFRRRHGTPAADVPHGCLVTYAQNHDQIGNRPRGDRLERAADFAAARVAAGLVILSPYTPLLFMGQEYADPAPFLYFISHSDPDLVEAVRRGRREEFAESHAVREVPDPQAEATFLQCRLDWTLRTKSPHDAMLAYHSELLKLRRSLGLARADAPALDARAWDDQNAVAILLNQPPSIILAANLSAGVQKITLAGMRGEWRSLLDSGEARFGGPGARTRVESVAGGLALTLDARTLVVLEPRRA